MPGWLVGCLAKKINNKFGLRLSVHFSHAIEFKCLQFSIFFFFFFVAFDRICLAKEFNKSLHKLLAI